MHLVADGSKNAGAVPIRLCGGSHEAALAGDELVPRDICPVVRASAGFTSFGLLPIYERCDAVVVPTTCDGKRKLGEALSDFLPVWMLEVPHIKEAERSRMEWLDQIYALKRRIEKLTRKKINRKNLREAIARIGRAQYQARRLHELRAADPPVVLGRHAMLALNAYAFGTVDEWAEAMIRFNDELEQRREDRMFRLKQLAEKFRIDGVIYHVLKGCMIYDFEVARVERMMKEAGRVAARSAYDRRVRLKQRPPGCL